MAQETLLWTIPLPRMSHPTLCSEGPGPQPTSESLGTGLLLLCRLLRPGGIKCADGAKVSGDYLRLFIGIGSFDFIS